MKNFTGADFRDWRVKLGLTQEQAAEMVGVTVHTVRKWEQGAHLPPRHVPLLIERLGPGDTPAEIGKKGNRPIGVSTKNRRMKARRI
jgi:DNA-binding XRE family transcriptional regulator